ncbi:MAG: oxidoreductase [Nocardioides sp.]
MRTLLGALALSLAVPLSLIPAAVAAPSGDPGDFTTWSFADRTIDDTQSFRGLDGVDDRIAWVAGENITDDGGPGAVYRTRNGGKTWKDVSPEVGRDLAFRDVEATSAREASVLAIGEGRASRIYRTTDGGKTWEKTFQNTSPQAFFNCIDFYAGGRKGLGVSDPVKGKFRIIETRDRGRTWTVAKRRGMPAAVDGEFNFAASGTCLTVSGRHAYMASGGAASRIFHSRNFGSTWTVTDAPIPATDAGGVFSLSFKRATRGVAVGGDFLAPDNGVDASGLTRDRRSWKAGGDLGGYRSGSSWVDGSGRAFAAVGPTGIDATTNGGRTWTTVSDVGYHAVACVPGRCWTSGSEGRIGWVSTQ